MTIPCHAPPLLAIHPAYRSAATLVLILAALLLSACQLPGKAPVEDRPPVDFRHSIIESRPPGCSGERCPLVNIDTLQFPGEPRLNQLIDIHLRAMTLDSPDDPMPSTLVSYQHQFLKTAEPGWSTWLQAKLLDWHGSLLVVELSSYLNRGGAHGMPGRGFINYDRQNDRLLRLQDMLITGQEGAFWQQVLIAHQAWLTLNKHDQDAEYLRNWPFRRTSNVALLRDRLLLKYEVTSIAPYNEGHPELSIPYSSLQGILRPEWIPDPGASAEAGTERPTGNFTFF